jgi:preprotein translocase subunit YajC
MVNVLYAMYGPQGGGAAEGQGGNPMGLVVMIIAIFAVMYFLMIRPQQRQKKQQQDMLSKISKGDKIVTAGGLHGTVVGVKDTTVIVKVADNVKMEFNRSSISQIVSSRSSRTHTQSAKTNEEKSDQS